MEGGTTSREYGEEELGMVSFSTTDKEKVNRVDCLEILSRDK